MSFKIIDTVFDGMLFRIDCPPSELHKLFNNFKHINITIKKGIYHIHYLKTVIATINSEGEHRLIIEPGFYIHRKVEVFKTLNKLLRTFTAGYFLKFISNKWVLCKEIKPT